MKPEKITELREERGLTKEALAQVVGVSPNTVSYWEKGLTKPNEDNEKKLQEVLSNE